MKDMIIYNKDLRVHVNPFGAELKGIEKEGIEYLWQGDVRTYPRTSPTLFPIIGRFLSDTYYVGDKAYHMTINGFAQDANFIVTEHTDTSAVLRLTANDLTRSMYPFEFELEVTYSLSENRLMVKQVVSNHGEEIMPFCVGCHTAYKWPLFDTDSERDYYLAFEQAETLQSFNPFGWQAPFLEGTDRRMLDHSLFENYTRSLKGIRSHWIKLASTAHEHAVRIDRREYPYLAIWSMPCKEAALICLEPCTSLHPGTHPSLYLGQRDGALELNPGEVSAHSFTIEVM